MITSRYISWVSLRCASNGSFSSLDVEPSTRFRASEHLHGQKAVRHRAPGFPITQVSTLSFTPGFEIRLVMTFTKEKGFINIIHIHRQN